MPKTKGIMTRVFHCATKLFPYLKQKGFLIFLRSHTYHGAQNNNMGESRNNTDYDSTSHPKGQHGINCEDYEQKEWHLWKEKEKIKKNHTDILFGESQKSLQKLEQSSRILAQFQAEQLDIDISNS